MGVPKFYRWISERYPQINQLLSDSTLLPEFDNLYLDMNGIIHACSHPNDADVSKALSDRQIMLAIFRYIDRIVSEIVKPKRVLFMAVDGVAPRAKLNQQRARRFRSAQERTELAMIARQRGETVDEDEMFDSNCITPGTEFMDMVGKHLRWFIRKKMKEDSLWKNLEITFSGHDVPGEGEHKIMQFIRDERAKPNYPANLRHCMYGQDADLIMLGLATHELHFALLREVINFNSGGFKGGKQTVIKQTRDAQFQLLHLSILREYIEIDFGLSVDHPLDKERLIDDFILMTFLVGNDFLPHLPTLDISEHAFDVIFGAYKELLSDSPGYLVEDGEIRDLARFERLCAKIGVQEAEILQTRADDERVFAAKRRRNPASGPSEEELEEAEEALQAAYEEALVAALAGDVPVEGGVVRVGGQGHGPEDAPVIAPTPDPAHQAAIALALEGLGASVGEARVRGLALRCGTADEAVAMHFEFPEGASALPPSTHTPLGDEGVVGGEDAPVEVVRRGRGAKAKDRAAGAAADSHGNTDTVPSKDFHGRYYFQKFKVITSHASSSLFFAKLIHSYLEGLMWCLSYYIKGCVSWTWYFPYHYGPMLQDMVALEEVAKNIHFELGQPFFPFQQLLGCLPPASSKFLPRSYQWLMTNVASPVKEFYPADFQVDMDGKRNPWEAVVLLSFIDERRLLAAEEQFCPRNMLSPEERARNSFGKMIFHRHDPTVTETYLSCNPEIGLQDVTNCQTVVEASEPSFAPGQHFRAQLVAGTSWPLAGFPSLTTLEMKGVKTQAIKLNVFGSESKYKSIVLELNVREQDLSQVSEEALTALLGKSVFVNYPQLHEAQVAAVSTEKGEFRLSVPRAAATPNVIASQLSPRTPRSPQGPVVTFTPFDHVTAQRWRADAGADADKYLRGRGTPGSGGLVVGDIALRLSVCALQGMRTDPVTGARVKVFGRDEADVPFQLALWRPVSTDARFVESGALSLDQFMPHGCDVLAVAGPLRGQRGRVVGPHGPPSISVEGSGGGAGAGVRPSLREEAKKASGDQATPSPRVVDVEFSMPDPEPPFGYAIAAAVKDEYFPSYKVCKSLGVSPSALGKIIGSVVVEPGRHDIGLDFKRNGQYQLPGYIRRVHDSNQSGSVGFGSRAGSGSGMGAWGQGDTVQIVGSKPTGQDVEPTEKSQWEFSIKAILVLDEYKTKFPGVWRALEHTHAPRYSPEMLFGDAGVRGVEEVNGWLKGLACASVPRAPLNSLFMSNEAVAAVERAADVRCGDLAAKEPTRLLRRGVPVDSLLRGVEVASACDAPLALNTGTPRLGDRVVNITSTGVPFGLRGTVVAIHGSTGFVEVLFDTEFVGGRRLAGAESAFRGRLCPWSGVLRVGVDESTASSPRGAPAPTSTGTSRSPRGASAFPAPDLTGQMQQQQPGGSVAEGSGVQGQGQGKKSKQALSASSPSFVPSLSKAKPVDVSSLLHRPVIAAVPTSGPSPTSAPSGNASPNSTPTVAPTGTVGLSVSKVTHILKRETGLPPATPSATSGGAQGEGGGAVTSPSSKTAPTHSTNANTDANGKGAKGAKGTKGAKGGKIGGGGAGGPPISSNGSGSLLLAIAAGAAQLPHPAPPPPGDSPEPSHGAVGSDEAGAGGGAGEGAVPSLAGMRKVSMQSLTSSFANLDVTSSSGPTSGASHEEIADTTGVNPPAAPKKQIVAVGGSGPVPSTVLRRKILGSSQPK